MRTIRDILRANEHTLWSVTPDSSVNNAIQRMVDKQVRALPVLEAGEIVGVISQKDFLNEVILKGKSTRATQVGEIMARNIVYATPAQFAEDCLVEMNERHIRHLPVMADGSVIGFVSKGDLFRTIISYQKDLIHQLENYIMGVGYGQ